MKVAVSAGHYPARPGATYKGISEHEIALKWQRMIIEGLERRDVQTVSIEPGVLGKKIAQVNESNSDIAVEVHFNSDARRAGKGSETLYYPGSSKGEDLANEVQRAISSFCDPNRGAKEGWYRMDRPGHRDYVGDVEGDEVVDAFLRKTSCTSLILEPYFIHEMDRIEVNEIIVCDVIAATLWRWMDDNLGRRY